MVVQNLKQAKNNWHMKSNRKLLFTCGGLFLKSPNSWWMVVFVHCQPSDPF